MTPRKASGDARRRIRHRDRRRRGGAGPLRRIGVGHGARGRALEEPRQRRASATRRGAAGRAGDGCGAGRRLVGQSTCSASESVPAPSPDCGSAWPPRARSPRRWRCPLCRWARWRRWRAESENGQGPAAGRGLRFSTPGEARPSPPSTDLRMSELWPPLVAMPGELAERVASLPAAAAGRRFGGDTISR